MFWSLKLRQITTIMNDNNYTDLQKKVEVIARERIQNFMLALNNLIITLQKNQNSVV